MVGLSNTQKHILPDNLKVGVSIDDVRLKSNLKIIQTLIFTKNSIFYTILGFTKSHNYPIDDIDGFYQLIAGSFKGDRPFNITGIDEVLLKCDCFNGRFVNGTREPVLCTFGLSSPPGYKMFKETRIKRFKRVKKSVLSHIIFYLKDDDHKLVNFNGETISFTCQLIKL